MGFKKHIGKIKEVIKADKIYTLSVVLIICLVFSFVITKNYKSESLVTAAINGEIVNPGKYTLEKGSKIKDLIELAGGFTKNADRDIININEGIADSEVITVLKINKAKDGALININTATASELMTLSGIGETYAKRIIEYREKYGGFKRKEHLMNVKGIGEEIYNKIKLSVTV